MELAAIQNKIYEIRGRKVMLDFDLADMYGIETAQLKRSVRRNAERFEGEDFMFQVSKPELSRCQIGILNRGRGKNIKYLPFAFGELGIAMLSSMLNSVAAIEVNRRIMRAFVAIRECLLAHASEAAELAKLQQRILLIEKGIEENLEAVNDLSEDVRIEIDNLYNAIGALSLLVPQLNKPRPRIGFKQGYR